MSGRSKTKCPIRRPISVWDLPKLVTSVHEFRKPTVPSPKLRPHYVKILAFVYRNRFVIANQIQRRFPEYLTSDRTTRRHLAEMEASGLLTVQPVNGVSPLMPKVYSVTTAGLTRLRKAYAQHGKTWTSYLRDRRRRVGQSFPHVFHELAVTEFLLAVWKSIQSRRDLELPLLERRSLLQHPAFRVTLAGRKSQLQPDGLFLFRHQTTGSMACFVEIDTGSESERQWRTKLRRYAVWSQSQAGQEFLTKTYADHGAQSPAPKFRLPLITCETSGDASLRRLTMLCQLASAQSVNLSNRIWMTNGSDLTTDPGNQPSVGSFGWICGLDLDTNECDQSQISVLRNRSLFPLPPAIPLLYHPPASVLPALQSNDPRR